MSYFKTFWSIIIFIFLTVITQIGGFPYLLNKLFYKYYKSTNKLKSFFFKIFGFVFLYTLFTFFLVPVLAKTFGRVPLPFKSQENIQPLNIMTCILNRHYVTSELKDVLIETAKDVNRKYPNTILNYLDANFPFFDKFPLIPHLSHNDGKKLDISFCYLDSKTNISTNLAPSFIGYGICEEPTINEINTTEVCIKNGNWQYSFMRYIIPQGNKVNFKFDNEKTKFVINLLCGKSSISKIFIEPHLKNRMSLTNQKIRFHGCHAVRHDDHIHIQVK